MIGCGLRIQMGSDGLSRVVVLLCFVNCSSELFLQVNFLIFFLKTFRVLSRGSSMPGLSFSSEVFLCFC